MRRYFSLAGIGLLGLIAAGAALAQSRAGTQPTGDVFSSRGAPDERRKYLSPDGRFLDRCGYDTATIPNSADTRLYGMPDHVPIDVEIMKQYVRCAVDACAPDKKAVCWGKASRQNPGPPTSADAFNSNGFTNCQADGLSVICDPPKLLPILPAVCLADNAVCETKFVFRLYAKENSAKTNSYYDNYGKPLQQPMWGKTDFKYTPLESTFKGTILYVKTPAGFGFGSVLSGPVQVQSTPPRFKSAVGNIEGSAGSLVLNITSLRDLQGKEVLGEYQTIRVGLGLQNPQAPTPRR